MLATFRIVLVLTMIAAPIGASCPDFAAVDWPWTLTYEDGLGDAVHDAATAWAIPMFKFDGRIFVDSGRRVYHPDRNLWFQREAPGSVHVAKSKTGANNVNLSCRDSKHWIQVDPTLAPDVLTQVVMHEIGHALIAHKGGGTGHIDDGVSIMRSDVVATCPNRTGGLSAADIAAVNGVVNQTHVEPTCGSEATPSGEPTGQTRTEEDEGDVVFSTLYDGPTSDRYQEGYDDGHEAGYDAGHDDGYATGFAAPRRSCSVDGVTLDLHGGMVGVSVEVFDRDASPHVAPEACTAESGVFTFYGPDNWELLVKVLDGCASNGHWWTFVSGATDREWLVTVTIDGRELAPYLGGGVHRRMALDTTALPCQPP